MLKTEIAISKLNENKHGLDLQSSKEEISRTYEKIDEDIKSIDINKEDTLFFLSLTSFPPSSDL